MGSNKPGDSLKTSFKATSTTQGLSAALNQRKNALWEGRGSSWLGTNVLAKRPQAP